MIKTMDPSVESPPTIKVAPRFDSRLGYGSSKSLLKLEVMRR